MSCCLLFFVVVSNWLRCVAVRCLLCAVVVMCCVLLRVLGVVARMLFVVCCCTSCVVCLLLFVGVGCSLLLLIACRCGPSLPLVVRRCLLSVVCLLLSFALLFVVVRCGLLLSLLSGVFDVFVAGALFLLCVVCCLWFWFCLLQFVAVRRRVSWVLFVVSCFLFVVVVRRC